MAYVRDRTEPINSLIDRYFHKRKMLSNNTQDTNTLLTSRQKGILKNPLPENPVKLVRDQSGRVCKCIYGDFAELIAGEEASVVIWQEEIIRDNAGKTIAIITTYPDGAEVQENLLRHNGKVTEIKVGEVTYRQPDDNNTSNTTEGVAGGLNNGS